MGTKGVLNDAAGHVMTGTHPWLRVDEKALTTDGAANTGGEFRLLAGEHVASFFGGSIISL